MEWKQCASQATSIPSPAASVYTIEMALIKPPPHTCVCVLKTKRKPAHAVCVCAPHARLQVADVGNSMLQQLLGRLRTNIQLPECLRVMGYLRRIGKGWEGRFSHL